MAGTVLAATRRMREVVPTDRYDVVIAGAGPAGSHLAIRLARAGWSVALVDRKAFPRHKPCGEFMSPECLPLLDEVGLRGAVLARGASRIRGMRLSGHGRLVNGRYASVGMVDGPYDHGYALRREVLDLLSFEAAAAQHGVTVLPRTTVHDVLRDADGRVFGLAVVDSQLARRHLCAAFTIGADGLRSRVARALGVQRPLAWLDKLAIVARYGRVPPKDHAEVHFFPGGYVAAAPVDGDLFTLNLVVDRARAPGRSELRGFLRRHVMAIPELAERLADLEPLEPLLACGPLGGTTTQQTFDGAALVGDACGYVDPVTGEGLYYAMRGAALLAERLDIALLAGRTDRKALREYVRERRREFGPRYALARLLQRGMRHPRVVRGVLRGLEARPRFADLLVAMTGESLPPRALLRPSLWGELLRGRPATG